MTQELPQDAIPISTEELLAMIGELSVQVRVLRRMLAQRQTENTKEYMDVDHVRN